MVTTPLHLLLQDTPTLAKLSRVTPSPVTVITQLLLMPHSLLLGMATRNTQATAPLPLRLPVTLNQATPNRAIHNKVTVHLQLLGIHLLAMQVTVVCRFLVTVTTPPHRPVTPRQGMATVRSVVMDLSFPLFTVAHKGLAMAQLPYLPLFTSSRATPSQATPFQVTLHLKKVDTAPLCTLDTTVTPLLPQPITTPRQLIAMEILMSQFMDTPSQAILNQPTRSRVTPTVTPSQITLVLRTPAMDQLPLQVTKLHTHQATALYMLQLPVTFMRDIPIQPIPSQATSSQVTRSQLI